jgi:hypothetical protein
VCVSYPRRIAHSRKEKPCKTHLHHWQTHNLLNQYSQGKLCTGATHTHAPITPNFPSGSSRKIVGDYVEKHMSAHHFSHYYSRRCRRMVLEAVGVTSPSGGNPLVISIDEKLVCKSLHAHNVVYRLNFICTLFDTP